MEHLARGLGHVGHGVKLLLELRLFALFVVFKHSLVGVLKQTRLGSFLEFLGGFLNIVKLLVYNAMHLLIQINQLSAPVQGVSGLDEGVDHGAHTLVVLAEDGLEDGEVEVGHLEDDLVENVQVSRSFGVLVDIEQGCLQTFHYHIVSVYDFLGQNHEQLIDLLVVCEPQVFEFEKLTGEEVFLVQFKATFVVLCPKSLVQSHIFYTLNVGKVGS